MVGSVWLVFKSNLLDKRNLHFDMYILLLFGDLKNSNEPLVWTCPLGFTDNKLLSFFVRENFNFTWLS